MRLFFDRKPTEAIDEALPLYERSEFASVTRSTVPLLTLLKHGHDVWRSIVNQIDGGHGSEEIRLEFTVRCPQGRGTPSHTDVMLINGNSAIAFEAKWTCRRAWV
jgi:hypothetical protein